MRPNTLARKIALPLLLLCLCCAPARAQEETWVQAEPARVVPRALAVFNCEGQTGVSAGWVFNDGGYRVVQPPVVSREGQKITLDARVEEWTGVRTLSIVPFEKNFELGALEPGTYTLDFKSWGTTLKQLQFTVPRTPAAAQPIDRGCFFVMQHYRDFLSREPDGSGLGFWTNQIGECGLDAQCIETKRINVSGAFFLSIEFRETGYYLYRIYRAALGRPPTFAEFVPEAAALGRNVVVGSVEPWLTRLDGNKVMFTQGFTNRQDFLARYNGLTNAQYVDKLFETEGISPTKAERDELVNSLDHCSFTFGCPTRATVLRKIVERPDFDRKVINEALVTMQYFGYLRRDPDDEGFQFWLRKLNEFGGDFRRAEMVKAFITSDEYRNRF
ncbi:MAG TPA: DUF4214 domain-containing protein [Pyrinomonadaceae bacterium]|nr:DUF4214 domain-containing protein [Pyrinomonadaceae bacterium]